MKLPINCIWMSGYFPKHFALAGDPVAAGNQEVAKAATQHHPT
jgi:hypothetical protein